MWDQVDPELREPLEQVLAAMGGGIDLSNVPGMRAMLDGMTAAVKAQAPPIEGVAMTDGKAPGIDGEPDTAFRIYRPEAASAQPPALVWMHAGGFTLGGIEMDDLMAAQLAKDIGCAVVSVEYRLAPEHPFPAALNDCYTVLNHVAVNGQSMGLAPDRIAIGGASAGGGLAAGLALMARDRGRIEIAHQLLIYPAINDKNTAPADAQHPDTLFWSRANNISAWKYYLGDSAGTDDVSAYAAPYRADDLSRLPPAYIAVGSLDLFIDDNVEYAKRLEAAGTPTRINVYPGAFHAFDVFAPASALAQRFIADRNDALRAVLG